LLRSTKLYVCGGSSTARCGATLGMTPGGRSLFYQLKQLRERAEREAQG